MTSVVANRGQPSRISIVGATGSGKSHLARELARKTDLPVHELDTVRRDVGLESGEGFRAIRRTDRRRGQVDHRRPLSRCPPSGLAPCRHRALVELPAWADRRAAAAALRGGSTIWRPRKEGCGRSAGDQGRLETTAGPTCTDPSRAQRIWSAAAVRRISPAPRRRAEIGLGDRGLASAARWLSTGCSRAVRFASRD